MLDLTTPALESMFLVRRNAQDVLICVTGIITAHKAGIPITIDELQAHLFAGGDVGKVVTAMVEANRARIHLDFDERFCGQGKCSQGPAWSSPARRPAWRISSRRQSTMR